ncbi:hypothetical protein NN561_008464 [Cricetulus griseus]
MSGCRGVPLELRTRVHRAPSSSAGSGCGIDSRGVWWLGCPGYGCGGVYSLWLVGAASESCPCLGRNLGEDLCQLLRSMQLKSEPRQGSALRVLCCLLGYQEPGVLWNLCPEPSVANHARASIIQKF